MREARLCPQRAVPLICEIGASYAVHLDMNIPAALKRFLPNTLARNL